MMDSNNNIPSNEPPPPWGLREPLRSAVEQVRNAAPPTEAVERSIDRAQQLGPPQLRRSRRWGRYCAVAGIAAAILAGFGLWFDQQRKSSEQVAWNQQPAPYGQLQDRATNENHDQALGSDWGWGDAKNKNNDELNLVSPAGNTYVKGDLPIQSLPKQLQVPKSNTPLPPGMDGRLADALPIQKDSARPAIGGMSGPESGRWMANPYQGYLSGSADTSGANYRQQNESNDPRILGRGMNGGMMGMRGGMPAGPQAAPYPIELNPASIPRVALSVQSDAQLQERIRREATRSSSGERRAMIEELEWEREQKPDPELIHAKATRDYQERELKRVKELAAKSTIDQRVVDEVEKRLEAAEENFRSLQQRKAKTQENGKPQQKQPQVWHRDRSRPTFARVYVGAGNSLELVSLHVSVTIEGPRARTVVDHIFRNPHNQQLEGTFEYPLPTGASPSYFAMFLGQTRATMPALFGNRGDNAPLPAEALARLTPEELVKHVDTADWGRLQEARIVSKQKALETYEEVVRGRIDPALLEYAGGNTFSGRVFPIPPKGYNRLILAYEELLPFAQEQMLYRFPLPNCKLHELHFSLQAKAAECVQPTFIVSADPANRLRQLPGENRNGRITFRHTWKDSTPEGEAVFVCTPANTEIQAISGRQGDNGPRYVYARVRPALKTVAKDKPFAAHAVFLLDTSLSEHPERFAVNMRLLQKILETDRDIKHFNILTFNVGAAWLDAKGFFANTAAGREQALKKLDGLVLEGATDISCALDKLAAPPLNPPPSGGGIKGGAQARR